MNKLRWIGRLILASASPRRQELLKGLDVDFDIRVKDCDESVESDIPIEEHAQYIANKKALEYAKDISENEIIITSDTTVVLDHEVLNKAADEKEAREMLRKLSGRTHRVITGVCIQSTDKKECFSDLAYVRLKSLSEEEIDYYISKYQPFDKAGAYGIQEWLGYIAIEKIEGSYYTIMGFPLHLVYEALNKF